jgi:hypothetical protein
MEKKFFLLKNYRCTVKSVPRTVRVPYLGFMSTAVDCRVQLFCYKVEEIWDAARETVVTLALFSDR